MLCKDRMLSLIGDSVGSANTLCPVEVSVVVVENAVSVNALLAVKK